MRIRTADGRTILNPRFLRAIEFDGKAGTATAIGDDGRKFDLDYDPKWVAAFDPVIPGSGVLLVAYMSSEEPNATEDLRFVEYRIVGWRIENDGGALPVATGGEWNREVVLRAIQEIDRWVGLGIDGLNGIAYRDRTEFEHSALASAKSLWKFRLELHNRLCNRERGASEV